ncbi:MAG: ParA family protein [Lactobacillus sp.]|nr:ParA family protein [Lactobacillus sp.]
MATITVIINYLGLKLERNPSMEPQIISFYNTSDDANRIFSIAKLARVLGDLNQSRILLIDLNPKANLTLEFDSIITLKDPIDSALYTKKLVIRRTQYHNISLVPAGTKASLANGISSTLFRQFLKEVACDFNYIIMDIAHQPAGVADLGIRASDHLILPVAMDFRSLTVVPKLGKQLKEIATSNDHEVKVAAFIATDYDPRVADKVRAGAEIKRLAKKMATKVLGTENKDYIIVDAYTEPVLRYKELVQGLINGL